MTFALPVLTASIQIIIFVSKSSPVIKLETAGTKRNGGSGIAEGGSDNYELGNLSLR
jgi:hypothetical protein